MDEKHLDTENGRNSSDSCGRRNENVRNILSVNSLESSIDETFISEASIAEGCCINNNENCNTSPDKMGDKSCTASYAESLIYQTDTISAYEIPSPISEDLLWMSSCGFTKIREIYGYSSDNSSSKCSSFCSTEEEEVSPHWYCKSKCFRNELKKNTNNSACLYGKSTINSNASDTPKSSGNSVHNRGAISCCLDSLEIFGENIATNQEPTMTQIEKEYKDKCASLPNTEKSSSSFLYNNAYSCDLSSKGESLIENGDNGILNSLENLTDVKSSLNSIITTQTERCSFIATRSFNESDIIDKTKKISNNNNPVYTKKEMESCPETSPIVDKSDQSLNNFLEEMICSKLPNDSESDRRNYSSLKNREGISPTPSINKEYHLNETDVSQYNTLKRPRSYSPTAERESKIIKRNHHLLQKVQLEH